MSDLIPTHVTDPADPNRCQGQIKNGQQCLNVAEPGELYCSECSGSGLLIKRETLSYRGVKAKDRQRLEELQQHHWSKSMQEDYFLVQLVLEEALNERHADNGKLDPAKVQAFEKLVARHESQSRHLTKLQLLSNEMIPRTVLLQYLQKFADCMSEELKLTGLENWQEVQLRIAERFAVVAQSIKNE